MKKILVLVAVLASMIGCSNDNKITIRNDASYLIKLNFRAQEKAVNPGEEQTISDIPNGTYSYNTTFQIPSFAKNGVFANNGGGGELAFEKQKTKWLFIYSSVYSDVDSVYTVYLNKTSSTSSTSSNPTSN